MSDFLQNLNASVNRNQALIAEHSGRELRMGDRVVSPDDHAPSSKAIVDTVEDTLKDNGLELSTDGRRKVEEHVRHLDTQSNEVLYVDGKRKETYPMGKHYGLKRAGEYSMGCRTRIRNEKTGFHVEVEQSWGKSGGATRSESSTDSESATNTGSASVTGGPVKLGASRSETKGKSATQGAGESGTTSSSAQATTQGERREGEVFLRCDVESTTRDTLGQLPSGDPDSESSSFDVELGKHSIIRQTK